MDERLSNGNVGDHWWTGLQVDTYWSSDEWVLHWRPDSRQVADQNRIFDDEIVESTIVRHCVFAATAAAHMAGNRKPDAVLPFRYVPVSVRVTYLRPTPINEPFTLRVRVIEIGTGKTCLTCSLIAQGVECARADVKTVRVQHAGN